MELLGGEHILWNEAVLSIGITDLRGIRESVAIKINGSEAPIEAGAKMFDISNSGLNTKLTRLQETDETKFDINLSLNGSHCVADFQLC